MSIVEAARKRYTTKVFDTEKKIPAEVVKDLCELTRLTASSTNSQPWDFVLTSSDEGRAKILKSTHGDFAFNDKRINTASHLLVISALTEVTDEHLEKVTEQEDKDGRYATAEIRDNSLAGRKYFRDLNRKAGEEAAWSGKQAYIALGSVLLGAAALGVDACPIEGFDTEVLDAELGLKEKGFHSQVIVALGYHDESDFNAKLPKSRLPYDEVFTEI